MMVRRQVIPRWADDLVQRHVGVGGVSVGWDCPYRKESRRREERAGQAK